MPFGRRVAALCAALLLPLAAPAAAADAASAGCTVVAGGGALPADADSDAANRWRRLNFAYFDAALTALSEAGRTVPVFADANAHDAAAQEPQAQAEAAKAGCQRVARFTIAGEAQGGAPVLVFVLAVRQQRAGTPVTWPLVYERRYRFTATPEGLEKVVPSRIADRAVRDYQAARPATPR